MPRAPAAQEATWAFVQKEWTTLTAKLGVFQGMPAIVSGLGGFCSTGRAAEIRAFFAAHPLPEAARGAKRVVERYLDARP
jgi:hypothetical protein